jgi:HTH-type transcriptional regulator/antitoxin HigA
MALAEIDKRTYARLLTRVLPQVITTDHENERMVAELEKLDTRSHPLSPEEERLAQLMGLLIRQFEESCYSIGHADPVEALRVLMESRGLRQRDLITVFGSSSVASDVFNGKRAFSKTHVRKLAEFFHVPASLFI